MAHTVIAAFSVAAGFGGGAGEFVRHPCKADKYAGKAARHGVATLGKRCEHAAACWRQAGDKLALRQRQHLRLDQLQGLSQPAGAEPLGGEDESEECRRDSLQYYAQAGDARTTGGCGEGAGHELEAQA